MKESTMRGALTCAIGIPVVCTGLCVAAPPDAFQPGASLIVVRATDLQSAKVSRPLTPGTKLIVAADEHPASGPGGEGLLVSLAYAGHIGRVEPAAVIPQAEAVSYFTSQIEKNPSDAAALRARGKVWFHLGERDKALADLDEAIRLSPDSDALTFRAWTWKQKNDLNKAIADFDAAIRLNPQAALAWRVRGATWAAKGDSAKALADFGEAIRLDPENLNSLNHRASFLAGSHDPAFRDGKQALADATRACEISDWKDGMSVGNLAAAYSTLGDFDAAVKWNARAIELVPEGQRRYLTDRQEQYEKRQPFRRTW